MKEEQVIKNTQTPNTIATIESDLKKLGLKKGMTIIVHSSLSQIGWICGSEQAVIEALMNVITEDGNIVMPTQSTDVSDPKHWGAPPIPDDWWQIVRDTMPAFNPKSTPTRGMGRIAECFRTFDGVKRSNHPTVSFAAWGANADKIVENHELSFGFGKNSPLRKIYDLSGHILLLGVDYDKNTSLHLSESCSQVRGTLFSGAPIMEQGKRVWKEYECLDHNTDDFLEIGLNFEKAHHVSKEKVGNATAKLMNQRELVDFGMIWYNKTMK